MAGSVLVRTLVTAVPSIKRLTVGISSALRPIDPSFFEPLPQLAALRELEIFSLLDVAVHLIASLDRLTVIRLPSTSLVQGEVQLLVNMPSLRELSARNMHLDDEVDSSTSALQLLDLQFLPPYPEGGLLLPLRPGMKLRIQSWRLRWHLGPATTQEEVSAAAATVAKAAAFLTSFLEPSDRDTFTLNWDALPGGAAGLGTAGVLLALAPLLPALRCEGISLEHWAVDAAHIKAIAGVMPSVKLLNFHTCHVTSEAWMGMHALSACSHIWFQGSTRVSASDVSKFALSIQRGCKINLQMDDDEYNPERYPEDPLGGAPARAHLRQSLSDINSKRLQAGEPPVDVVFHTDRTPIDSLDIFDEF